LKLPQIIVASIILTIALVATASAGSRVMEIACGSTPLTDAKKCSDERTAGSELEIIVNPSTQKVQISVTKNSGKYFGDVTTVLEKCSVVDISNWICTDEIRSGPSATVKIELIEKYGMQHGHYYQTLTGGLPPHYYTSSISGWRYWGYRAGLLSLERAEEYD
jgi:hypothetical protein